MSKNYDVLQASLVEITDEVLEARPPRGVWQVSVESL